MGHGRRPPHMTPCTEPRRPVLGGPGRTALLFSWLSHETWCPEETRSSPFCLGLPLGSGLGCSFLLRGLGPFPGGISGRPGGQPCPHSPREHLGWFLGCGSPTTARPAGSSWPRAQLAGFGAHAMAHCALHAGVGDTSFSLGSTEHPPIYYEFVGVRSCRDALHLYRLLWASAVLNVLGALLGVLTAAVLGAFKDMVSRAPALALQTARGWRPCPLSWAECVSLSPPPRGKTEAGVSPRASLPAIQRSGSSEVWATPNHARGRGHRTCPGQFIPHPCTGSPEPPASYPGLGSVLALVDGALGLGTPAGPDRATPPSLPSGSTLPCFSLRGTAAGPRPALPPRAAAPPLPEAGRGLQRAPGPHLSWRGKCEHTLQPPQAPHASIHSRRLLSALGIRSWPFSGAETSVKLPDCSPGGNIGEGHRAGRSLTPDGFLSQTQSLGSFKREGK